MDEDIKNKFKHLAQLVKSPMSDWNNINRLKRELEFINVANFDPEDWQLYYEVFSKTR